eukprot:CAMPEP_0119545284 /NCGR_PEP_ID=MMETSP1352-20130426/63_1 /TAXON_ID=265584 /ORGANISM="Stauroneis constricta, Strain CCMP1120" /LENGTH=73 /DNA_ID=CAMNT_0007589811 /DNA_START=116 /DNA_END=337 /DNA_ORIENTATION=-
MPVVLTAAAISGAAYGAYKGGQAAVKKGKESIKEATRRRRRNQEQREFSTKQTSRKDKIASIQAMRDAHSSSY